MLVSSVSDPVDLDRYLPAIVAGDADAFAQWVAGAEPALRRALRGFAAHVDVEAIVQSIHEAGTKIVMSTHNLGQARRIADEILFLHGGRLVERAPVERFFAQPASAEASAFIKGELPWV